MSGEYLTEHVDIPKYLKIIMIFIDRVGFPVLAFILMFVMCFISLNNFSKVIEKNTLTLTQLCNFQQKDHEALACDIKQTISNQEIIKEDLKKIMIREVNYVQK